MDYQKNYWKKLKIIMVEFFVMKFRKKIMNDSFNLNNEDELKAFEEAGGHEDKCPSVISQVVTFISEMIVEG